MGPSETQAAVRAVAAEALAREGVTWDDLAAAGLLALPIPADLGGEGLGLADLGVLVRAVGTHAVHLPVVETLAVGALTIASCGTSEQQAHLLKGVAEGTTLLAPAVREPGSPAGTSAAVIRAEGGLTVSGRKIGVGYAESAAVLLVLAALDGVACVVLVDPHGPGVTLLPSPTSRGATEHTVLLEDAPAELLGDDAARVLVEHHRASLCLLGAGLVEGARDLTAAYVKEREQFGRRLAEFQAVAQQVADVYVASRGISLAADNAAWRVAQGLPSRDDLAAAAYWLCAQGTTALHTCHHLHGGMGVDVTYPLHRYYSWLKDVSHALGGGAATLEEVGVEDTAAKNLELTDEQRALKARLRAWFGGLVSPEEHREIARDRHGATYRRTIRRMGEDGWMGVGWPKEHGGHGLGEVEQTVFANEAQYADVHLPSVTLQTVGPTLQAHGTELQKQRFLGPILRGEVHFAIGYSEPDAGTDLASLRTTARREGDHYVVNGQKIFTTGGHAADYVWLAVRTDPDAPKHRGISILIVDTADPGYSWTPIITCDGAHHVNATYYNDVRVPVDMLVGQENEGWRLITTQLNHERVMLGPAGRIEGLRDRVYRWAREAGVADRPDVRLALGEVTAAFRVNELLNWEVARAAEAGAVPVADASASKVFASEAVQRCGRLLAEVVARYADPADPAAAELLAYLDGQAKRNLVLTFGGGVNEVQRELIAMFGLGLPKVPR